MTTDHGEKERAKDLYIVEEMTLEQVARETEIPEGTIKRWSAEYGWAVERREYQKSLSDIKRNTVSLRKALIAKAMQSLDPQDVYAASRLESISARTDKKTDGVIEVDRPKIFLEDMEFVATTLKEIDPEGLKIFARNFEIIVEKFKGEIEQKSRQD